MFGEFLEDCESWASGVLRRVDALKEAQSVCAAELPICYLKHVVMHGLHL